MKIAHIVCTYPPYYSGMATVAYEMTNTLAFLGHDVTVFTPQLYPSAEIRPSDAPKVRPHEPEVEEQIQTVKRLAPTARYGNAASLPELKSELTPFDLVHLHYPFFGTANIVRKWKLNHPDKPLVVTYHMDARSPGWKGLVFKYYTSWWMPKILDAADRITVSSFDYLESSSAAGHYHAHQGKWLELPFGVNLERFRPRDKSQSLKNLNLSFNFDINLPTIIFVGGMDKAHYFKGIPVLFKALYALRKSGLEAQALFVGDGELRAQFERQAGSLGLNASTFWLGRVLPDQLPMVYNLADLLILPSIHQGEAFGLVLLEAFASGVPVVASDLPGVRSVAERAGILVQPNDPIALAEAIAGYFSPDTDQAAWRQKARQVAEDYFAWGPICERLAGVYEDLVNSAQK